MTALVGTKTMRVHMDFPGEVVAGTIIAGGLSVFGWIIKLALGEAWRGLQASLLDLRHSVDNLASQIDSAKEQIAEHDSRLAVAEARLSRMGN
jgi:outer membrane murein-binding lipoprotein Lpp